jgi:hypothetical protein
MAEQPALLMEAFKVIGAFWQASEPEKPKDEGPTT